MAKNNNIPKCNQCDSFSVNGIYCHESGCPNEDKKYNHDTESWESVYTCFECGCEYDNPESAGECCGFIQEEEEEEEEEEETQLYDVFVRSWWIWEDTKFNGRVKVAGPGEKTYTHYGVSLAEAKAICKEYNESHNPGELSIKSEFEAQ